MDQPTLTAATGANSSWAEQCVKEIVTSQVSELRRITPADDVERTVWSIRHNVPLDYDADWRAFAIAYLLVNYRKALHILRMMPTRPGGRVTDIGCGSGAAALAYITVAAERNVAPAIITLLDRSRRQLDFAHACADQAINRLQLSTRTTTDSADMAGYVASQPQDVFLCANVLTEQRPSALAPIVTGLFAHLRPGGCFLAIERGDDEPWRRAQFPILTFAEHHSGQVRILAPKHGRDLFDDREWSTGWYTAVQPEHWMQQLVLKYFDAWTRRDVASLALVFASDAIYHEKPFDVPLRGLAAIESYWTQRVASQRDIHLTVLNVTFGYLTAAVEWSASFSDEVRARQVNGIMILEFDPALRRVRALREVFRTHNAAAQ